mmetsp:Transcript_30184/g.76946  ORF Transcript_30184/g.76946 Transcript_30184/m.76946 type:complete len:91 (+) Transcript_30184:2-274(+)
MRLRYILAYRVMMCLGWSLCYMADHAAYPVLRALAVNGLATLVAVLLEARGRLTYTRLCSNKHAEAGECNQIHKGGSGCGHAGASKAKME